jgi:hypothetical protein
MVSLIASNSRFIASCFRCNPIVKFYAWTGLSDLTLTTDVPDAGDEDVFMVKKIIVFILFSY